MTSKLDSIIQDIDMIDNRIDMLKRDRKKKMIALNDTISGDLDKELSNNDYGCGTLNINTDLYKIKAVVSKKVKWDDSMLEEIEGKISEFGEDAGRYIKTKRTVSETDYKRWRPDIQKFFEPAREVSKSEPKITYELNKVGE